MTITPKFKISQTEECVQIDLKAIHANFSDIDFYIEPNSFIFSGSPYFLRLNFKQKLDDSENAVVHNYDAGTNTFQFSIKKLNLAEHFTNLDSITSLLSKPDTLFHGIEELDPSENQVSDSDEEETLTQLPGMEICFYGEFKASYFSEIRPLLQIQDIKLNRAERLSQSRTQENIDFDLEHFEADKYGYGDNDLLSFTGMKPISNLVNTKIPDKLLSADFSDEEFSKLESLPKRRSMLTKNAKILATNQFLEILYAICYVNRVNEFDPLDAEPAAYMLRRMSLLFSWFVALDSIQATSISVLRRSLIYTVRRNLDLSTKVFSDVRKFLNSGSKVPVLRLLLQAKSWLEFSEQRILSNSFLVPLLLWIQTRQNTWFSTG